MEATICLAMLPLKVCLLWRVQESHDLCSVRETKSETPAAQRPAVKLQTWHWRKG